MQKGNVLLAIVIVILAVLLISGFWFVSISNKACGGIAANLPQNQCPFGFTCQLENNYPDSAGKCVFVINSYFNKKSNIFTQNPTPTISPINNISSQNDWKNYKSKDGLFEISYPKDWSVNDSNGISFGANNQIQMDILVHERGDEEYVKELWQTIECGGKETTGGCAAILNKETKSFSANGNIVYYRVSGGGQMHAYIPNSKKNKTIEIYSVYLEDKQLFDQIIHTFRFLN